MDSTLDGLHSIFVSAFASAFTAGFCVLMISWPRLCSITSARHSLCVFFFLPLSPFYFLSSLFFCRLDFSLVNGLIARTLRLEAYCLTRGYFVSSFSVNQFVVLCRFPESNINAYIFGSPIRTSRTIYNHMQVTGANSYTIDR